MRKITILALLLIILATLVVVGCAESRGTGYSTYGNVPPPQVSGGGCGVGAPALENNAVTSGSSSTSRSPAL